jgi:hypothetical protein
MLAWWSAACYPTIFTDRDFRGSQPHALVAFADQVLLECEGSGGGS